MYLGVSLMYPNASLLELLMYSWMYLRYILYWASIALCKCVLTLETKDIFLSVLKCARKSFPKISEDASQIHDSKLIPFFCSEKLLMDGFLIDEKKSFKRGTRKMSKSTFFFCIFTSIWPQVMQENSSMIQLHFSATFCK